MKKIFHLIVFAFSFVLLLSCVSSSKNKDESQPQISIQNSQIDTIETEPNTNVTLTDNPLALEPNKINLPTYEQFQDISEGMSAYEVQALVGNPQRTDKKNLPPRPEISVAIMLQFYIYDTSDGYSIGILYSQKSSESGESSESCVSYWWIETAP